MEPAETETSSTNNNRYTIGKYLRNKKKLKKKDSSFVREEMPPKLKVYLEDLMSKGAKMNKLAVGKFKLKNGLEYPGMVATEDIHSDQILMEIPREMLLTTRQAWFSPVRSIFQENPDYFSPNRAYAWEDRMLMMFLIYEHSRGKDSPWYHLLENLSRDIDYVIFWPEEELELLEDESLVRLARGTRSSFEEEAQKFLEIAKKYPDILKEEFFTYENVRWIYIHLTTRCFGKYFEYVTMVPMAELLNHECTDVFYDFRYNEDNPHKPADQHFDDPKPLTEEEIDNFETSDGTYGSIEHDQDSDFDYDQDSEARFLSNTKKQLLKEDEFFMDEVKSKIQDIKTFFTTKFNWCDTLTTSYMKEILCYLDDLEQRYEAGKLSLAAARKEISSIETQNVFYKNEIWKYYKEVLGKAESEIKIEQFETIKRGTKKKEEEKKSTIDFKEDKDWKEDKFDTFIMKAAWKDQFEKEAQVFFCYGRLSNRLMLMRYGMTLEYNKYDHVHFKIPYIKYLNGNTWLIEKIKYYKVPRIKKLKARRRKFAIELLDFFKSVNWKYKTHTLDDFFYPKNLDLELQALEMMKEFYEEFLKNCKESEEELEKKLTDPALSYHQYFATVLNLERQRGIRFHYRSVKVLIEILNRIKSGLKLEFALLRVNELESEEQYHRNRVFFEAYTDRLKKVLL